MELFKHLPVAVIARLIGVGDKRLWRFIKYYVKEARDLKDYSDVKGIGMDETSKKGHNYITVMVDLSRRKVIYATEGKDHIIVDKFVEDFKEHKGDPDNVKVITCDMSLDFRKGIKDNFPNSETIIDKFHIIKHINDAVDKVRKEESKTNELLKKTKYLWLKNDINLTDAQREWKSKLLKVSKHLKTGRAYSMRVELQGIYEQCLTVEEAETRLKKLCSWLKRSRLQPMKDFVGSLKIIGRRY